MPKIISMAPPNSLLFIADVGGGETPTTVGDERLWSTSSCIVVGCLASMDGETEVTLGESKQVDPGWMPAFDGLLETPSQKIVVSTLGHEAALSANVSSKRTHVRIWTNHPREPDRVIVGLN